MRPPSPWTYSFLSGTGRGQPSGTGSRIATVTSTYSQLFGVTILHDFYDGNSGLCPDFVVRPTPTSIDLMRAQGLVFRANRYGFNVYFNEQYANGLIAYVKRQGQPSSDAPDGPVEYWSRLSFELIARNPLFVGITSIPICANPIYDNLYAANSSSHWSDTGKHLLLAPGEVMNWSDSLPVRPAQFSLDVHPDTVGVIVMNLSGATVLFVPVPVETPPLSFVEIDLSSLPLGLYTLQNLDKVADQRTLVHAKGTPPEYRLPLPSDAAAVVVTDKAGTIVQELAIQKLSPPAPAVVIDLRGLPYGTYIVQVLAAGDAPAPTPFVYTSRDPAPLCFLDILFTCPKPGMTGVYPISSLPPGPPDPAASPVAIGNVQYELRFQARSTQWQYYVVSQNGGRFTELKIDSPGVQFQRQIVPPPPPLPNGEQPALFVSDAVLPLRQLSSQEFSLKGWRVGAGGENEIRVARLPVAPDTPVWPGSKPCTGISEMFVYV